MPPIFRASLRLSLRTPLAALIALFFASCAAARAPEDEVNRIVELMDLRPGMRVADVGAGDGEFAEALAARVGPGGRVFATEVDEDDLDDIERRFESAGLANGTVVLGDDVDTGLGEDCCDAVLLRLVYHHFTKPAEMRESLRRALRPGAPLVLIDITTQSHWGELDDVPDRGGHGIPTDVLIDEMTADGFKVVKRFDEWPGDKDHFCVVFVVDDEARAETGGRRSRSRRRR